jgi:large subunit ribosomal protein L21
VVSFGRVLAVKADDEFHIGRPYVEGVTVEAEIVEELKGPKVIIYKMKPKKHTRKTVGHRQPLTKYATTSSFAVAHA